VQEVIGAMEYTVQKLARLAGVSARTIRYYDEIGLLKPVRLSSSGYRIYGRAEVDRLQQILLYRELGCSLEQIQQIIASPSFDALKALQQHRLQLLNERKRLDALIANVEKTIAYTERRIEMADTEKFEGFKQELIERNEQEYGAEVRAKYGDETVDRSNEKLMRMSQAEYEEAARLADDVLATLAEAFETGDPGGPLGQKNGGTA
jgi:DNA-binding transcriptional MerR regulator